MLRCKGFGHTAKICFGLLRCAKCGKDHLAQDCEEKTNHCVNCKGDHPAFDSNCPFFMGKEQSVESKLKQLNK